MNHLIIYGHPNTNSFNNAIMQTLAGKLKEQGEAVRIRDIYSVKLDPFLTKDDIESFKKGIVPSDVKVEQEHIQWADTITLIYPIWFGGPPAGLKGYMDRVFSEGFAYAEGGAGLLIDKKGLTINTIAAPYQVYQDIGMFKSLNQALDDAYFKFCGIEILGHEYFSVVLCGDEERQQMLEKVKEIAVQLSS